MVHRMHLALCIGYLVQQRTNPPPSKPATRQTFDAVKLKVTFDALNRVLGLHRALFSSFLGDLVREHIGLKILCWKKVKKESRDKLWDEITRYFDVDSIARRLIEKKEIEADEEPPRGVMWLKGRLNKDGEFLDEEIRSLGEKLKDADDKIKEGTLNLDDGTDAMTVVFGKEKGGYARGVGSGVTYKKYFDLPRSRQATDERMELLQTQLDNERRERQELSTEMKEKDLNLSSPLQVPSDVTPVARINNIDSSAYEADGTQSIVVVRDKDARIQKKSNGLVISENGMEAMEPVKTVRTKKTPKSR
ncbi:hypothetical protein Tco_0200859 [Tanacetum coccineum]